MQGLYKKKADNLIGPGHFWPADSICENGFYDERRFARLTDKTDGTDDFVKHNVRTREAMDRGCRESRLPFFDRGSFLPR